MILKMTIIPVSLPAQIEGYMTYAAQLDAIAVEDRIERSRLEALKDKARNGPKFIPLATRILTIFAANHPISSSDLHTMLNRGKPKDKHTTINRVRAKLCEMMADGLVRRSGPRTDTLYSSRKESS